MWKSFDELDKKLYVVRMQLSAVPQTPSVQLELKKGNIIVWVQNEIV